MVQGPAQIPPYQPQGINPNLLFLLLAQQRQQQQAQPQGGPGLVGVAKGLAEAYGAKEGSGGILQGLSNALGGGSGAAQVGMAHPEIATPQLVGASKIPAAEAGAGSLGSAAAYIPPALAIAYGAKTAADFAKGKDLSTAQKLAFALPTAGLSLVSGTLQKKLGLKSDEYKQEQNRMEKLRKKGVNVPDALYNPLSKGRSKDELVAIENEKLARGQYGNPTFAQSRNVADLKPEDTWGYSAWLEKYGNDYLGNWTEDQRRKVNQYALDNKLVKEHHGTIDVNFNPEMEAYVNQLLGNKPAPEKPSNNAVPLDKPIKENMTGLSPEQQKQVDTKFDINKIGNILSRMRNYNG